MGREKYYVDRSMDKFIVERAIHVDRSNILGGWGIFRVEIDGSRHYTHISFSDKLTAQRVARYLSSVTLKD